MNKLEKDLLFYSNYCLHSSNLINSISKTALNDRIFYICIDDKKIKIKDISTLLKPSDRTNIVLIADKSLLVSDINKVLFELQNNEISNIRLLSSLNAN